MSQPSAISFLAAEHYRSIGLDKGWTWQQVQNLCRILGWTENDLFAVYGMNTAMARRCRIKGFVPTHIALHFKLRQDWHLKQNSGIESPPVLPVKVMMV